MDIGSGNSYPSSALSNFAPHPFVIDGVQCNSMEGFLQSLKFESVDMQKYVCTLVGKAAKFKGKNKKWWKTQTLYWQGKAIARQSKEYQVLLDRAYNALYENAGFRNALEATKGCTLTHSIGKNDKTKTVLTQTEFCSRLKQLRDYGKIEVNNLECCPKCGSTNIHCYPGMFADRFECLDCHHEWR